ncbi:hypothetical protein FNB79_11515 [Formosa sediminum]|uniref:Uncharacterized protein n=1 Tax=Formosa sediminum TaxID=2594004 RepID=A0A516GSR4_9FLAO|nr:hypothetical protein [Formosa sediminum]QDO94567.1 hypothetical protein FNB79_11515 [Formosa sediminum]
MSLLIAIIIPFELFLFSYAILGPLHYLTEITWLREKNYFFSAHKNWVYVFIILSLCIAIAPIVQFSNITLNPALEQALIILGKQTKIFLIIGFLFALSLIFLKRNKHLALALIVITLVTFLTITYIPKPFFLIGAFLPTLIHVYIFTFFFIIYGAIKAKSTLGIYLGLTLLCVPFIIAFIPFNYTYYTPSKTTFDNINSLNMNGIFAFIAKVLNNFKDGTYVTLSEIGIRIQIFVSFAYTYHYLNWFSKTSIIGWRKSITKKNAIIILAIWICAVSLCIYDFNTGLIALYFLSFLHVLLEFPLNIISIQEVLRAPKNKSLLFLIKSNK